MRRVAEFFVALGLVAGCEGEPITPDPCVTSSSSSSGGMGGAGDTSSSSSSGSGGASAVRLVPEIVEAEDGSVTPTGRIADIELGIACTWRRATDGALRCLPGVPFVEGYFADPACTQWAVVTRACEASQDAWPRYVTTSHALGACGLSGPTTEVRAVSPEMTPAYALDAGGACVAVDGVVAFAVEDEVLPSTFVAGVAGVGQ